MLLQEERTDIVDRVAELTLGFPDKLKPILGRNHIIRISVDTVPFDYASNVVDYCELSAWVEDPALIIKLLDFWKIFPIPAAAIQRLKTTPPPIYYPLNRPWETCLLALNLPFINREITRQSIEYFMTPIDSKEITKVVRVLIVNGPSTSGKTFTYDYISYVNSIFAQQNFKTVYLDYKVHVASRFGQKEFIEALLSQINPNWKAGPALPELDAQQPARLGIQLLEYLADRIEETGIKHFIVLDRFDDKEVPRETLEMIQLLAETATGAKLEERYHDLIRLVLLGFSEAVPNFKNRVRTENITPIVPADIEKYFRRYALYKNINVDDQGFQDMVNAVFIKDPGEVPFRTKILAKEALDTALLCIV